MRVVFCVILKLHLVKLTSIWKNNSDLLFCKKLYIIIDMSYYIVIIAQEEENAYLWFDLSFSVRGTYMASFYSQLFNQIKKYILRMRSIKVTTCTTLFVCYKCLHVHRSIFLYIHGIGSEIIHSSDVITIETLLYINYHGNKRNTYIFHGKHH